MSISKDAIESYINTMNDPNPKELEGNCFFSSEKRYFKSMSNTESKEPSKKVQQTKHQKNSDGEWEKVSQKFRKSVTITPSKNNTSISSALDQNWRDGTKNVTPLDGTKKTFSPSDKFRIGKNFPMKSELDDNWRCKTTSDGNVMTLKNSLSQKKENRCDSERETNRRESFNLPEKVTESILNENIGKDNHFDPEINSDFRIKFDTDPLETYNSNFNDFSNSPPNQWNHLADQGMNTNFSNSINSYGIDMNGFPNGKMPFLQNPLNFPLDSFHNNIGSLHSNGLPKNLNMFNVPLETGESTLLPPTFPPFLPPYKNGFTNNATVDPFSRLMIQQRLSLEQEMQNYQNYNPLQMMSGPAIPLFAMNNLNQFTPEESFTMNNIYQTVPENEITTRSENKEDLYKGDAIVMVEILPYPKWHHDREKLQWTVLSVEGNQSGPYDASDLSVRFISGDLSPYIRFVIYGGPSKKWARLIDLMKTANERNPFVSAQSPRIHKEFLMVDFYYKGAGQQMNFEHWRDFISSQLEKERIGILEKSLDGRSSNLSIQKLDDVEHYDDNVNSNIETEFSNDHNENSIDDRETDKNVLYNDKDQNKNNDPSTKCSVVANDEASNWISTNQKPKKNKKSEVVSKSSISSSLKNTKSTLSNLETAPKTQIQKPAILSAQKVWDSPNIMPDDPSTNEKTKLSFKIGDVISTNESKSSNKSVWNTVETKNVTPVNFADTVQKKIPQTNTSNKVVKDVSLTTNGNFWNNENDSKLTEEPKDSQKSPTDEKEISSRKELEVWLREKLKALKKNVDYEVFCSFIIDVEHPSEVEDYFLTYFGDTPAVKKFIKQFLEKRSEIRSRSIKAKLEKDDLSAPAQAVGFTIQTSKKNKKQKVNAPPSTTTNIVAAPSIVSVPTPVVANNNGHSYSSISANLHIPCKNAPTKPSLLSTSKNWETPNIVPDDPEIHEKVPLKFSLGDILGVSASPNNSSTVSSSAWSSGKVSKITTSTPTIINTNSKSKKATECPWKTIGKNVKK